MPHRFFALSISVLACACASSETPADTSDASGASEPPAAVEPAPSCSAPAKGIFMVDITVKTSCPWWDSTRDHAQMRILEDAVQYPNSDDLCGDIQRDGCKVRDECGPIKFSAGSQGWIGKASMDITFTDDEHIAGTVTYDIGDSCKVEIAVTGEHLDL